MSIEKNLKMHLGFALGMLGLASCGVGPTAFYEKDADAVSSKDTDLIPAARDFDPELLLGSWDTGCVVDGFGGFRTSQVEFRPSGEFLEETTRHVSEPCESGNRFETIYIQGRYQAVRRQGILLSPIKMSAVFHHPDSADSASREALCDIRNWKVGELRDLTATVCKSGNERLVPVSILPGNMVVRRYFLDLGGLWRYSEHGLTRR